MAARHASGGGEARGIAAGALPLMSAKAIFVVTSFGVHVLLARVLTPDLYGVWGVVISITVSVESSFMGALAMTAGKLVSEDPDSARGVAKTVFTLQLIVAGAVIAVIFMTAPLLADALNDDRLTFYLRLSSVDIPIMGAFLLYGGLLSGRMEFRRLALKNAAHSLAKLASITLLVAFGLSLAGAVTGNILASVVGFAVAWRLMRFTNAARPVSIGRIVRFSTPLFLHILSATLLGSLALYFLKGIASDADLAGFYSSASNLIRAPDFVLAGVAAALFPSFSSALSAGDRALGVRYVRQSVRMLLLLLLPTAAIVIATADELVELLLTGAYLPAAAPLRILMFGLVFSSFLRLFTTTLIGGDRPRALLYLIAWQLPAAVLLNLLLIPRLGMDGAAISSTVTAALGCGFALYLVKQWFGGALSPRSLLRIGAASLAVYGVARLYAWSGPLLVPFYLIMGAMYLALLVVTREITTEDRDDLRALIAF